MKPHGGRRAVGRDEFLRTRSGEDRIGLASNLQRAERAREGQGKANVRFANTSASLWARNLSFSLSGSEKSLEHSAIEYWKDRPWRSAVFPNRGSCFTRGFIVC